MSGANNDDAEIIRPSIPASASSKGPTPTVGSPASDKGGNPRNEVTQCNALGGREGGGVAAGEGGAVAGEGGAAAGGVLPPWLMPFIEIDDTIRIGDMETDDDFVDELPPKIESLIGRHSLRVLNETIAKDVRTIFHLLEENESLSRIRLTGWDLYHGHVFGPTKNDEVWSGGGILFHAKEHPKEFTESTTIYVIGSPSAGGALDPRIGTELSIRDTDFHVRNFIFSNQTSTIYYIDVLHESFPRRNFARGLGRRFFTVDELIFGPACGVVHYFPSMTEDKVFYEPFKPQTPPSQSAPLTAYRESPFFHVWGD